MCINEGIYYILYECRGGNRICGSMLRASAAGYLRYQVKIVCRIRPFAGP